MDENSRRNPYDPTYHDLLGDALPPPAVIAADGKVWKVGFPTQAAKALYERVIIAREREIVGAMKLTRPKEEYEARQEAFAQQVADKEFAVGGVMWVKHSLSPIGWLLWVQSLLMVHHPDVTREQVIDLLGTNGEDVKAALGLVVPPFLAFALGRADQLAGRAVNDEARAEWVKAIAQARAAMPELLDRLKLT